MIRAVVVGINDYPSAPLSGCINDADDVIEHIAQLGASYDAVVVLKDRLATKEAIQRAVADMIASSQSGDRLLFHYSGHGSQVRSVDVYEQDSLDECLCPVDFDFYKPAT